MKTVTLEASFGFEFDKARDGWVVVENVPCEGNETLELAEFLHEGETWIGGEELVARAKEFGNLAGQLHAEKLLHQQAEIPAEWRDFYLVFPGTAWRHPGGGLYGPYLDWGGGRWCLDWGWLGYGWGRSGRLVRLCK